MLSFYIASVPPSQDIQSCFQLAVYKDEPRSCPRVPASQIYSSTSVLFLYTSVLFRVEAHKLFSLDSVDCSTGHSSLQGEILNMYISIDNCYIHVHEKRYVRNQKQMPIALLLLKYGVYKKKLCWHSFVMHAC